MGLRKKVIGILVILVLAVTGATVILTMYANNRETISLDLYYINDSATSIVSEKRDVEYDNEIELVEKVLEELRKGPTDSKNIRVMDKDTRWVIERDGTKLMVDFSGEFLTSDSTKDLLAAYAVVKSLCQLNTVNMVKVMVEGEEMTAPDNTKLDYLSDKDINLETDAHTSENRTVKLYFADKDGYLVPEYRTIKITDTMPVEQYIVSELIKGPQNAELSAVISADTQLISAELSDATAYINLGQSFIDRNAGSPEKQLLAVYSIVNSVTELPGVNNVQILIGGKKVKGFDNIDLEKGLFRNEAIISKDFN